MPFCKRSMNVTFDYVYGQSWCPTSFVQECSDVERWVVEDVEMEEEEKCSDQPKPFCWDVQVCLLYSLTLG